MNSKRKKERGSNMLKERVSGAAAMAAWRLAFVPEHAQTPQCWMWPDETARPKAHSKRWPRPPGKFTGWRKEKLTRRKTPCSRQHARMRRCISAGRGRAGEAARPRMAYALRQHPYGST